MKITYCKATEEDGSIIRDMFYYAIHVPGNRKPVPAETVNHPELIKYHAQWGGKDDLGWIARDGGKPVGAAWLRLLKGKD